MNLPMIKMATVVKNLIAKPLWVPYCCVKFAVKFAAVVSDNRLLMASTTHALATK